MRIYNHEFCLSCFKENPQDREICECGGRNFVFGDHIKLVDKQVVCDCGSTEFKMTFHMNCSPIYDKTYKCECGKCFGMQTYHKSYDDPYDISNLKD